MSDGGENSELAFVTSNRHKFEEAERMFRDEGISIRWVKQSYEEIQADTTEEISMQSAIQVSRELKTRFFLDDTGLYINSLSGFPGPYSSYVFRTIGNNGILKLLDGRDRDASFTTVVTYYDGVGFQQFSGTVKGTICFTETGKSGFGYDPIFVPKGMEISLSQMDPDQKNEVSHRGIAIRKLIAHIKKSSMKA